MARKAALNYGKLAWLVVLSVVVYNEYIAYWSHSHNWPSHNAPGAIPLLLVADPQIQGVQDEPPGIFGWITRWDSDRYLSKTFDWAVYGYRPKAIIFLGDLIDEGIIFLPLIFKKRVK